MDVIEALQSRHCARAFLPEAVSRDALTRILEAASHSPSYANSQPWEVFVAAGEALDNIRKGFLESFQADIKIHPDIPMAKVWPEPYKTHIDTMGASHLKHLGIARDDKAERAKNIERNLSSFGAPAVIYLCLHKALTEWSFYDLGLFSQSLMLAAQHNGFNTIPAVMLAAYPELIREELAIPEDLNIVIGIAIGRAIPGDPQNQFRTSRRPIDDFVRIKGV